VSYDLRTENSGALLLLAHTQPDLLVKKMLPHSGIRISSSPRDIKCSRFPSGFHISSLAGRRRRYAGQVLA
jgi:hypothetical protein